MLQFHHLEFVLRNFDGVKSVGEISVFRVSGVVLVQTRGGTYMVDRLSRSKNRRTAFRPSICRLARVRILSVEWPALDDLCF